MFCANCGKESDTTFCASCGHQNNAPTSSYTPYTGGGNVDASRANAGSAAGLGQRILTTLLDGIPTVLVGWVLGWVLGYAGLYLATLVYLYVTWTRFNGRTLGNWALRTRVTMSDGSRLTQLAALKRLLVLFGPQLLAAILQHNTTGTNAIVTLLGIFQIVNFASFFSSPKRQMLHDRFADTVVVRTNR